MQKASKTYIFLQMARIRRNEFDGKNSENKQTFDLTGNAELNKRVISRLHNFIIFSFFRRRISDIICGQISEESTSPGSLSLSKDFFIIVHIDLQLSDGFQSFFLAGQLPFFVVHGDSILQDCDFPQEGVEAVHGIKTVSFLQGLEGCD